MNCRSMNCHLINCPVTCQVMAFNPIGKVHPHPMWDSYQQPIILLFVRNYGSRNARKPINPTKDANYTLVSKKLESKIARCVDVNGSKTSSRNREISSEYHIIDKKSKN